MKPWQRALDIAMILLVAVVSFFIGHLIGVRQALEWSQQAWAHVLSDSNVVPQGRITVRPDGSARYRVYSFPMGFDSREKSLRRLPRNGEGSYRDTQGFWWITDGEGKIVGY